MNDILMIMAVLLGAVNIILLVFLLKKNKDSDSRMYFEMIKEYIDGQRKVLPEEMAALRKQSEETASRNRQEILRQFAEFNKMTQNGMDGISKSNADSIEKLRQSVDLRLKYIQEDNEKKLEEMRKTVDDKLTETLNKRLTGSFKQVSDQLEQVFKSMGEMKTLATGVGDLKKLMSNVKTRGIWGEVQLERLITDMLTPAQYEKDVSVTDTFDRVEFAIKMPGAGDGESVYLPIDSKFPMENYIRLQEASAAGDVEQITLLSKALQRSIIEEAKKIRSKYINPPKTTNFAIMFLPVEGLYAEALKEGLMERLQTEFRVTIAGPTTLSAILNSLQMGFKTLAIEKQSGQVMALLTAVKKAFSNFTVTIEKTKKSLRAAQNNLDDAEKKTRTITQKLRKVDEFEEEEKTPLISEESLFSDTDE